MDAVIRIVLLLSMFSLAGALASTVQRCEGADGAITFTDLGCAEGASMSVQQAYNPPPGGGQASLLPEREPQWPRMRTGPAEGARVTIVGSREVDPVASPRGKPQTAKSPR